MPGEIVPIMSTTSRDAILHRIHTELSKGPPIEAPPVPEVWPRGWHEHLARVTV